MPTINMLWVIILIMIWVHSIELESLESFLLVQFMPAENNNLNTYLQIWYERNSEIELVKRISEIEKGLIMITYSAYCIRIVVIACRVCSSWRGLLASLSAFESIVARRSCANYQTWKHTYSVVRTRMGTQMIQRQMMHFGGLITLIV